MKKVFQAVANFFEAMGRARAAGVLVRQGRIEEAKNLYQQ